MSVVIAQKRNPLEGPSAMIADAFARSQGMQFNALMQKYQTEEQKRQRREQMSFEEKMQDRQMKHQKDLNKTLDNQRQAQIDLLNRQVRIAKKEEEWFDRFSEAKLNDLNNRNQKVQRDISADQAKYFINMTQNPSVSPEQKDEAYRMALLLDGVSSGLNEEQLAGLYANSSVSFSKSARQRENLNEMEKNIALVTGKSLDPTKGTDSVALFKGIVSPLNESSGETLLPIEEELAQWVHDFPNESVNLTKELKVGEFEGWLGKRYGSRAPSLFDALSGGSLRLMGKDTSGIKTSLNLLAEKPITGATERLRNILDKYISQAQIDTAPEGKQKVDNDPLGLLNNRR